MTDQEQRIAIAEACGWKRERINSKWSGDFDQWTLGERREIDPPDYLNDLNAMNQAETELMCNRRNVFIPYCRELERVCEDVESAHVADARQRAEAFLRTIGKWRDG